MKEFIKLQSMQGLTIKLPFYWRKFGLAVFISLQLFLAIAAQENPIPKVPTADDTDIVTNSEGNVLSIRKSVIVKGIVTQGVVAFGGDVIVEGRVEGDVATIGGSVLQREGSYIGGDVIVFGGTYHHGKGTNFRDPEKATVMYAVYEEELRGLMQNPVTLFSPAVTPAYFAQRILAILFWFLISLALTAIAPGAVSRAVTRLRLKILPISAIGALALFVTSFGIIAGLAFLPTALSAVIGLMALILLLLAYTFGRVAIQAATGNFLMRNLFTERQRSESVALLLGTLFWTLILSLPYIWTLALICLMIMSLGLVLTARSKILRHGD